MTVEEIKVKLDSVDREVEYTKKQVNDMVLATEKLLGVSEAYRHIHGLCADVLSDVLVPNKLLEELILSYNYASKHIAEFTSLRKGFLDEESDKLYNKRIAHYMGMKYVFEKEIKVIASHEGMEVDRTNIPLDDTGYDIIYIKSKTL